MSPAISVRGLSKRYQLARQSGQRYRTLRDDLTGAVSRLFRGEWRRQTGEDFWALRDVNFDIEAGEIVGVIGRNGAGKSTLLKILSRITPPTTGDIHLRGRVGSLLEIGTGFHPELSGRENIFLSGAILGMKRREVMAKFDEIVAFAEIEQFLDTPVKRFSSGMYVRLAFAVAAHLETEILLVDEVLAVGDVAFQKKSVNRMKQVGRAGRTVLFVSHNTPMLAALCQKGLILQQGHALPLTGIAGAIETYLGQAETAGKEWTGQVGDDDVQMLRTWISKQGPSRMLTTSDELEIGIDLQVKKRVTGLAIGFNLVSEYGTPLAYVLYDDTESTLPPSIEAGPLRCRFRIPPHTLSEGSYSIAFDVGINFVKRIIEDVGSLSFSLENIGGIASRYPVSKHPWRHSLFRPNWRVTVEREFPVKT